MAVAGGGLDDVLALNALVAETAAAAGSGARGGDGGAAAAESEGKEKFGGPLCGEGRKLVAIPALPPALAFLTARTGGGGGGGGIRWWIPAPPAAEGVGSEGKAAWGALPRGDERVLLGPEDDAPPAWAPALEEVRRPP